MSSSESTSGVAAASSDSHAPLLRPRHGGSSSSSSSLDGATLAVLFGRASGQGDPSVMVRETAARTLEERRAQWGYSKPVVVLDLLWNTALVVATAVVLGLSVEERPNAPIRVWICGYALQCLLHVVLVGLEYAWRNGRRRARDPGSGEAVEAGRMSDNGDDEGDGGGEDHERSNPSRIIRRCNSMNTMASFLWWIIGFYWVVGGGDILDQMAPRLYWLSVVFLALDVLFALSCVVLACLIGIALCCCLPCIIAILYTVTGQEGATEADLKLLPKYRFQMLNDDEKPYSGAGKIVLTETSPVYSAEERVLLLKDAECCICLCSYEDGAELHTLPCNHHFHSTCIVRWLKINATCPLCKFNVLKGADQV